MTEFLSFVCFKTYNEMLEYTDLREGMVALVLGETEVNDGKANFYYITAKTNRGTNLIGNIISRTSPFKAVPIKLQGTNYVGISSGGDTAMNTINAFIASNNSEVGSE